MITFAVLGYREAFYIYSLPPQQLELLVKSSGIAFENSARSMGAKSILVIGFVSIISSFNILDVLIKRNCEP